MPALTTIAAHAAVALLALATAAAAVPRECPGRFGRTACVTKGWVAPSKIAPTQGVPVPKFSMTYGSRTVDLLTLVPMPDLVKWYEAWYDTPIPNYPWPTSDCNPPIFEGSKARELATSYGACESAPFLDGESYVVGSLPMMSPIARWQLTGWPRVAALRSTMVSMGASRLSVCMGVQPCGTKEQGYTTILGFSGFAPFVTFKIGSINLVTRWPGFAYNTAGTFVPPIWVQEGGPPLLWTVDPAGPPSAGSPYAISGAGYVFASTTFNDGKAENRAVVPGVGTFPFAYQEHAFALLNRRGFSVARIQQGAQLDLFGGTMKLDFKWARNMTIAIKGGNVWAHTAAWGRGPLEQKFPAGTHDSIRVQFNLFGKLREAKTLLSGVHFYASRAGVGVRLAVRNNEPFPITSWAAKFLGISTATLDEPFNLIFTGKPGDKWLRCSVEIAGKLTTIPFCDTDAQCAPGLTCGANRLYKICGRAS